MGYSSAQIKNDLETNSIAYEVKSDKWALTKTIENVNAKSNKEKVPIIKKKNTKERFVQQFANAKVNKPKKTKYEYKGKGSQKKKYRCTYEKTNGEWILIKEELASKMRGMGQ